MKKIIHVQRLVTFAVEVEEGDTEEATLALADAAAEAGVGEVVADAAFATFFPPKDILHPRGVTDGTRELVSPTGVVIVGLAQTLDSYAEIAGFAVEEDGTLDVHHSGTTEIEWNNQADLMDKGQRVFQDREGGRWLEYALEFRPIQPKRIVKL